MPTWLYFSLKLVHLLAMAVWVGGSIVAPLGMTRTLRLGQPYIQDLVPRLDTATRMMVAAALVTVLSGVGLVFAAGGPSYVPGRILAGAALTPLIFVLGGILTRPALRQLRVHFAGGGSADSARAQVRRFLLSSTRSWCFGFWCSP